MLRKSAMRMFWEVIKCGESIEGETGDDKVYCLRVKVNDGP